mgnify:CR=1 FL=1
MAGIYIHIPFCRKLCSYCDFYHVISQSDNKQYIDALNREAYLRRDYLGNQTVSTIYIGGGTPSVLQPSEIKSILDNLGRNFRVDEEPEVTIELNPDDVTEEFLEGLKKTIVRGLNDSYATLKKTNVSPHISMARINPEYKMPGFVFI